MLEYLFGSKTRLKILKIFFQHSDRSYYVRELCRLLDSQVNAVRRELDLLIKSGLIVETNELAPVDDVKAGSALRKYYRLNTESILYPELNALILKTQVMGQDELTKELRSRGGKIKLLILTGQFTSEHRAPSDLLIVGDLEEKAIARIIAKYEKEFGFEIRYTTMSEKEFFDRRHIMDKFVYQMFEGENVKVVNELKM
jgi:hypothetical protein